MPVVSLTTGFLDSLRSHPPAPRAVSYFDAEIRGFLLEHRASGGATYYFRYRDASGRTRLCRIGRLGEIPLADARMRAYEMRRLVAEGGDPKAGRHRLQAAPLLEDFVRERYLPFARARKRSWKMDEMMLRRHLLPAFGGQPMSRVTRAEVMLFHQAAREKGYAAGTCNLMLVLLKSIFNCAIRWDALPAGANPCEGVAPFEDHGARERYLTREEVRRLFKELEGNPNVLVCRVIRLLLYTGARKREVLDARWDEIDWERRLLVVPASRSKSRRPRHIPLSDAALALLRSVSREPGVPWVFFNPRTGRPPVSIHCAWDSIRRGTGLQDVRLHDLRHSYASFLVNAGRSLYEVQRLLGHNDPKVTMRYAHLSPQAMLEAVNALDPVFACATPA